MSKLIRYRIQDNPHVGENVFEVCRGHVLGNPYTHIKDKETKALIKVKTREEAISLYKEYFKRMMESDDNRAKPFQNEFKRIVDAYKKYDVVYIGCYCGLDETCHGDFIIEQVIKYAVREKMLEFAKSKSNECHP